jgi:acetyl esterase/lipase
MSHLIKQIIPGLLALIGLMLQPLSAQEQVIRLYEGPAPGSETWDWEEKEVSWGPVTFIYNVVDPTLTVYTPAEGTASGTAVVVCPGGAFHFLSMDGEGRQVAEWLNEKGITAFVLKYRLVHCVTDNPMQEMMAAEPNSDRFNKMIEPTVAMDIADGRAAIAYVREHAGQWDLDTGRIGIMGFSAGGTVAAGVSFLYDKPSRPDFAAPIYPYVGSFGDPPVPGDAPPMFIAAASDDVFGFNKHCTALYDKWVDAGKSAELHIYRSGGHGFGLQERGIPTDTWIERFYEWLTDL